VRSGFGFAERKGHRARRHRLITQLESGNFFAMQWADFFSPAAHFAEIAPSGFFAPFNFCVFESFPAIVLRPTALRE
jgi:hypothetical protein